MPRQKYYYLDVDGLPARGGRGGYGGNVLRELRSTARALRDAARRRRESTEIYLCVRDWSATGGVRIVTDYSYKPRPRSRA